MDWAGLAVGRAAQVEGAAQVGTGEALAAWLGAVQVGLVVVVGLEVS
jgi:hypothetical protein